MSAAVDTELPLVLPRPHARPKSRRGPSRRLVLFSVALLLALVGLWLMSLVKPYRVVSGSMAPTVATGQRILADHLGDPHWMPSVDAIVIFKAPGGAEDGVAQACGTPRHAGTACLVPLAGETRISFVKRVVGLPGDRIQIVHGHVIRNGIPQREPFATSCDDEICNLAPFTVPAGTYYVLGDNRGDSLDSRFWGPVARSRIIGHAFASYWPLGRLGGL